MLKSSPSSDKVSVSHVMKHTRPLEVLDKVRAILLPEERRSALYLLILMVVGMAFEMLGLGVLVPVMTALLNPDAFAGHLAGTQLRALVAGYDSLTIVMVLLASIVLLYAVKTAFLAYLAWKQADFTYGILSAVSGRLFATYLAQPYEFHLVNNSARLVRNAVTESQIFALNVISPLTSLFAEILVLVGVTLLLIYIEPVGSIAAILAISSIALIFHRFSRNWSSHFGSLRQHHEGLRIKTLQEGLLTVKEVSLLGRGKNFCDRYDKHAGISASSAGRQTLIAQLPRLVLEFVVILGFAFFFAVQIYNGRSVDDILPVLAVFGAAAFRLMPSVNRILIAVNSLQYGLPVLDVLHEDISNQAQVQFGGKLASAVDGPIREFEFRDVDFKYITGRENAIEGINLHIRAGEMVGFVGPSGAGKSSLIDLFLGLLHPTSGEVRINGRKFDAASVDWKSRIGYVPQSIALVDDSIRRNVAFGLDDFDIDEAKVIEAIKAAQLQEFVAGLDDGLDSKVGEHGVRLSGGQRQRIGLARALYGNPDILVLDEATSALDTETENEIMAAIRGMHGKKTILIIAHRLSTVKECDRIVRLEGGRISRVGSPAAVLDTGFAVH